MRKKETEIFYPVAQKQWRNWLTKNHRKKDAVWVIFFKKAANKPTITWSEAVDEALCFGWIDSVKKSLDPERSVQYFSKRRPRSTWSKINREKVQKLTALGRMCKAGMESVELAKRNGSWSILESVDALIIPADLEAALIARKNAMDFFLALSRSAKKILLHRVILAKRPETRQKRIKEIAAAAAKKRMPGQI